MGNGNTGGTAPVDANSPYTDGATVTVLGNTASLTKIGYTFAGWNTQAGGGGTGYAADATFTITADVTLYAQWTNNFSDWISGYPGVGGQTGFNDDPDGDGNGNGLENIFGTDPSAVDTAGLSTVAVTTGGSNTFVFTHPENALPADDLSVSYEWSSTLQSYHADGVSNGAGTTVNFVRQPNTPVSGTTTVTATIAGTVPDQFFTRLRVTQN